MSKKIPVFVALLAFLGLTLFLMNCGSSSSRPSGLLYVLSQGDNNVGYYAVDLNNGKLSLITGNASTCPTAPCGFPLNIILDPTGAIAFVLDQNQILAYTVNSDGKLTVSGTPTPLGGTAMTRDAAGHFLLVASQGSNTVTAFSTQPGSATLTLVGAVLTGTLPSGLSIDPSGTFFYVVNQDDDTVGEYDLVSGVQKVGSPYDTGSVPTAVLAVKTTPTGGAGGLFVYVANGGSGSGGNSVSLFQVCTVTNATCTAQDVTDGTMLPVGTPTSVGLNPTAMVVDPTNNFLYVLNHGSNTVSAFRINQTTGALGALTPATVSTGAGPVGISMHSSGKFLFVSNNASSSVTSFNVDTNNGALSSPNNVTSSAQPTGLVAR